MDRPRRSVEQIEVIEHRIIEEGRRPIGSGFNAARDRYDVSRNEELIDRFRATGETDVSRDQSFLHSSANYGQQMEVSPQRGGEETNVSRGDSFLQNYGQQIEVSPIRGTSHLNTSTGSGHRVEFADTSANTVLQNYGYDVHEIHTSDGGARIVETHGGGPLRETSRHESTRIDEVVERPGITSALRSGAVGGMRERITEERSSSQREVFTVSPPARHDSWRNIASDSESFVRQDSYKRMQRSDELMGSVENSKAYAPRSQTSLVSRSTRGANGESAGCWARTKAYFLNLFDYLNTTECSPRLLAHLCCILLFLLLLLILLGIIFRALFARYSVSEFLLFPPVCEECRRKNPNLVSAALPSSVFVHFYSSDQAHFELRGNAPFKSNSFTAVDFSTGYVATADHALTDSQGRHFACFLQPLDRNAIPSMDALMEAISESQSEIQSTFGWQEFWQFDAEPIEPTVAKAKFSQPIADCKNAKWYLLKQTVHARDLSCSECFDFCLPDWAVVRKEKYEDESTLGVRRLDCFRLYVPEWNNFRATEDQTGGHWQYPLASESTKRDSNGEWVSWVPTAAHRQKRKIIAQ